MTVEGEFFFTDSIPFFAAAMLLYISLLPIVWPLEALSTKYG
jgi:hypothetical protein